MLVKKKNGMKYFILTQLVLCLQVNRKLYLMIEKTLMIIYTDVGNKIKKGDSGMLVEAMKTMNHVRSPFDGVVKEICVEDGSPVEFDQIIAIVS